MNYTLHVPRRVWLEQVATVNGAVHVSGVEGAGELRSVNGDVDVSDSSGGFSAHTTNGDIHVELARLVTSKPLTLETINGSVALEIPAGTAAALDVRCPNGDFHLGAADVYRRRLYATRGIPRAAGRGWGFYWFADGERGHSHSDVGAGDLGPKRQD